MWRWRQPDEKPKKEVLLLLECEAEHLFDEPFVLHKLQDKHGKYGDWEELKKMYGIVRWGYVADIPE